MKNKALKILFFHNGIFMFGASLLGPLYAIFVETIDSNVMAVSISWSAFLLSSTLCMVALRNYGDSIKEKEYMLLAGFLIRGLAWFSFPFIGSIEMLVVLQILLGAGEALGTPAFEAILAEHLDAGQQIKEYIDWKLIANLTGAIGVIIGGAIIKYTGFSFLFFTMGTLAMISFFGILFKPRNLL